MIKLEQNSSNEFIIYADTITNDVQTFGDYFLIGFNNGFTKEWIYVLPEVLVRNTRYLKLKVDLAANYPSEDPFNSLVFLTPSGNWDYKIWNTTYPTLDPSVGDLIDKGQMVLENEVPPELVYTPYVSDNETGIAYVYYSADGIWNNTALLWNYAENNWQN